MRDYNHIRDRVEREIDEIMTEKKWTPKHAEALEELLMTLKCIEEVEQNGGHKKKKIKKMSHYNYYEDDEEEDEDEEEMKKHRKRPHEYQRNNYENDNYERGNYERRMRGMGKRPIPMDYHYLPWPHDDADYMEDWDYGYGPPMNMMPPFRYGRGRGQDQYNQYSYPRNQYEQGMGSQGHANNGSGQSGSSTENSGTNTGSQTPVSGVTRK